jgi:hypothetical protein
MKTIWVLTSAAVTVFGLLTSQAEAQQFAPGNRPFVPNPGVGNNGDTKDRQYHVPLGHLIQHGVSSAAPGSGVHEPAYTKPPPSVVPRESFIPHARFNVPSSLPEVSASRLAAPRASWFESGSGRGILAVIAGGIASVFGALFGRKKDANS